MLVWNDRRKRVLGYCVLTSLAVGLGSGIATASAQEPATASPQMLETQISDLTQRLNDLEAQLKAVKSSEQAPKEAVSKADKKDKGDKGTIKWSGTTKSGYWTDATGYSKLKSEFVLYGDTNIGDGFDVNVGLKFKSTTAEPSQVAKAKAGGISTS